jgi:hypothetical protein
MGSNFGLTTVPDQRFHAMNNQRTGPPMVPPTRPVSAISGRAISSWSNAVPAGTMD